MHVVAENYEHTHTWDNYSNPHYARMRRSMIVMKSTLMHNPWWLAILYTHIKYNRVGEAILLTNYVYLVST